jgi:(p)ppGpp synthase/HD superfamily hydrolase
MILISEAITLATFWHDQQIDKTGVPYIYHPLRVMEACRKAGYSEVHQAAAVLHDILEDTFCPVSALMDIGPDVYDAVIALSRRKEELEFLRPDDHGAKAWGKPLETYKEYLYRCEKNPIARVVKIYDLEDNLDPTRYAQECPYDRYLWALQYLDKSVPQTYIDSLKESYRLQGWLEAKNGRE